MRSRRHLRQYILCAVRNINPYPAETESDKPLPPELSQANLHIRAVRPGSILMADHLQVLILISLKMKK